VRQGDIRRIVNGWDGSAPLGGGPLLARIISPLCTFVIPAVLFVTTAARLLSGLDYPGLRNLPGSEFIGTVLQIQGIVGSVLVILGIILGLCWSGAVRWLNGSGEGSRYRGIHQ